MVAQTAPPPKLDRDQPGPPSPASLERGFRESGGQMGNWTQRGSARVGEEALLTERTLSERRAARMGMAEIADRVWNESRHDPGIQFARKVQDEACPLKDEAREKVLAFFDADAFPGRLRILTFPGVMWRFEHFLLHNRRGRAETRLTAIERIESTYRAALRSLPYRQIGIRTITTPAYATAALQTGCKPGMHVFFERCHFEDLAVQTEKTFNGAWLDFNGQLTAPRLRAIRTFWEKSMTGPLQRLVVTLLNGRDDEETSQARERHGGIAPWMLSNLSDATLIDETHYAEPAPMVQVAFERRVVDAEEAS